MPTTAMLATDTPSTPDSELHVPQIDAGWNIGIHVGTLTTGPLLAEVVTTPNTNIQILPAAGSSYRPRGTSPLNKEMWWWDSAVFDAAATALKIASARISGDSTTLLDPSFDPNAFTFRAREAATWRASTTSTPTFTGTPYYFVNNTPSANLQMALDVSGSATSGYTVNGVVWYWVQTTPPTSGTIDPAGDYSNASGPPASEYQWAWSHG